MAVTVFIHVGEAETGAWCPVCLLPSAVRLPVFQICEHGSSLLLTLIRCLDCVWEKRA